MSAQTVAARVSPDPATQRAIVDVFVANGLNDRECERALRIIDLYLNVCGREGVTVDTAIILRAASYALDRVWEVRRPVAGEGGAA